MKRITLLALCTMTMSVLQAADLTVNIKNIRSEKGALNIVIYNNEKSFNRMNSNAFASVNLPIYHKTISLTLGDFPNGRYAVCVQHDINNNGKLDMGKNKMPIEAYACSNGARKTAVPTFKTAEFTHGMNHSVVNLRLIQPN